MEIAALTGLHLLGLLAVGMGLWHALRLRRLYFFLFLGLAAYQVLTLPALPALVRDFGGEIVFQGQLIMLLGAVILVGAIWCFESILSPNAMPVTNATQPENPIGGAIGNWRVYSLCVFFCLFVIVLILSRRGAEFLATNWQQLRAEVTRLDSLATLLQFMVIPAAWIAFRSGRRMLAAALFLVAIGLFVSLGSRAALLTLPAVMALDVYRARLDARRVRIAVITLIAVALLIHVGGRIVRGLGLGGLIQLLTGSVTDEAQLVQMFQDIEWAGGESEIARYFMVVVRDAPIAGAELLASPFRWIAMYLPRDLFAGFKPEDVTYVLWRHSANAGVFDEYAAWTYMFDLLKSGESGSVHPLLWGEMWMNGGLLAVPVFCGVLALWLVLADRLFSKLPPVVSALVLPAAIVGYLMVARGNSVIGLGYTAYLLPMAALLAWSAGRFDRALRHQPALPSATA